MNIFRRTSAAAYSRSSLAASCVARVAAIAANSRGLLFARISGARSRLISSTHTFIPRLSNFRYIQSGGSSSFFSFIFFFASVAVSGLAFPHTCICCAAKRCFTRSCDSFNALSSEVRFARKTAIAASYSKVAGLGMIGADMIGEGGEFSR